MMLSVLFIILALVFFVMMLIVSISGASVSDTFNDKIGNSEGFMASTITVGFIAIITAMLLFMDSRNPTAMDVYQGKTTLEITYKGGVPVDTVVVFKE